MSSGGEGGGESEEGTTLFRLVSGGAGEWTVVAQYVVANCIFVLLLLLAYLNWVILAASLWPAMWALIVSQLLWPLKAAWIDRITQTLDNHEPWYALLARAALAPFRWVLEVMHRPYMDAVGETARKVFAYHYSAPSCQPCRRRTVRFVGFLTFLSQCVPSDPAPSPVATPYVGALASGAVEPTPRPLGPAASPAPSDGGGEVPTTRDGDDDGGERRRGGRLQSPPRIAGDTAGHPNPPPHAPESTPSSVASYDASNFPRTSSYESTSDKSAAGSEPAKRVNIYWAFIALAYCGYGVYLLLAAYGSWVVALHVAQCCIQYLLNVTRVRRGMAWLANAASAGWDAATAWCCCRRRSSSRHGDGLLGGCLRSNMHGAVTVALIALLAVVSLACMAGFSVAIAREWAAAVEATRSNVVDLVASTTSSLPTVPAWSPTSVMEQMTARLGNSSEMVAKGLDYLEATWPNETAVMREVWELYTEYAAAAAAADAAAAATTTAVQRGGDGELVCGLHVCDANRCTWTCLKAQFWDPNSSMVELAQSVVTCAFGLADDDDGGGGAPGSSDSANVAVFVRRLLSGKLDVTPMITSLMGAVFTTGGIAWKVGSLVLVNAYSAGTSMAAISLAVLMFLSILCLLLMMEVNWLEAHVLEKVPVAYRDMVGSAVSSAVSSIFGMHLQAAAWTALFTYWLFECVYDVHFGATAAGISAIAAVLPLFPVPVVVIPATLEVAVRSGWLHALPLALVYVVLQSLATWSFYGDKSSLHASMLGVSIIAGIAALGLEGVILAPLLMSGLMAAYSVLGEVMNKANNPPAPATYLFTPAPRTPHARTVPTTTRPRDAVPPS